MLTNCSKRLEELVYDAMFEFVFANQPFKQYSARL